MKKFSTYLVVMFMIVFWILRIIITLSAEMGNNFLGITPINETFEIVILFGVGKVLPIVYPASGSETPLLKLLFIIAIFNKFTL